MSAQPTEPEETEQTERRKQHPELRVMQRIIWELESLDEAAKRRVSAYICSFVSQVQ
jgi:hypothetical protein